MWTVAEVESLSTYEEGGGCALGGMVPVREAWQRLRGNDGEGRKADLPSWSRPEECVLVHSCHVLS